MWRRRVLVAGWGNSMLFSSQQLPGAVIGRLSPFMQGSAKGTSKRLR